VGNILNVPLASGSGGRELREAFNEMILPALEAFGPDLLIISAGFDGHRNDPLAGLNFDTADFEWVTDALGSQGAVCSGGRYDGLEEKLGGRATPAVGWAMGIERFVALFEACGGEAPDSAADVYIVAVGEGTLPRAVRLAEDLRDAIAGVRVELNLGGGSFKSQMKRADSSNAEYALILGERELAEGSVGLKPMRTREEQSGIGLDDVATVLARKLDKAAAGAGAANE
jgi:histidyl-tRNA synthetase